MPFIANAVKNHPRLRRHWTSDIIHNCFTECLIITQVTKMVLRNALRKVYAMYREYNNKHMYCYTGIYPSLLPMTLRVSSGYFAPFAVSQFNDIVICIQFVTLYNMTYSLNIWLSETFVCLEQSKNV